MRRKISILHSMAITAIFGIAALNPALGAQGKFPDKPVTIVTGAQAGSGLDVLTRRVAEGLSKEWGQPVVVENKPGANNTIAARTVAKAPADGYMLFTVPSSIIQTTLLYKDANLSLKDFEAVTKMVVWPNVLAMSSSLSANNVNDLVKLAKEQPGKLTYGSVGIGSSGHLLGEILKTVADIDIMHVPYSGETSAINDLIGGRVDLMYGSTGSLAPHAKSGKIKIIAVASPQRLKGYPDFPTFAESGYEKAGIAGWGGLFAPSGTPAGIVEQIAKATAAIVHRPENSEFIVKMLGAIPLGNTPAEFSKELDNDTKAIENVITTADIKLK